MGRGSSTGSWLDHHVMLDVFHCICPNDGSLMRSADPSTQIIWAVISSSVKFSKTGLWVVRVVGKVHQGLRLSSTKDGSSGRGPWNQAVPGRSKTK